MSFPDPLGFSRVDPIYEIGDAVVIEEHTLGVVRGNQIQVLHSSILKGAVYWAPSVQLFPPTNDGIRLASRRDFDDFRVLYHPDWRIVDV